MLGPAAMQSAFEAITAWRGYAPTPLVKLSGLATRLGIAAAWYKNEAPRFGFKSFKALGGAYAVQRIVSRFRSAQAGRRVTLDGDLSTVMAGLSCGEPSLIAWDILSRGVDFFATLADESIAPAMRSLATGFADDPPLVCGESGVAGVTFLLEAAQEPSFRQLLHLDAWSQVLLFGTEGDTDVDLYRRLIEGGLERVHVEP